MENTEKFIEFGFWICFAVLVYTYLGYGLIVMLITRARRIFFPEKHRGQKLEKDYPRVTFLVAAYNESDCIAEKIKNTLELDYPMEKLEIIFVTDGSTDGTDEIIRQYIGNGPYDMKLLHEQQRRGKIAATNRAMQFVSSPVVIFSDANTLINKMSVKNITGHYNDIRVGGVSGEKRIMNFKDEKAAGAGEGLYWKYESALKKLDSELYSVVGAAGELFSVRGDLFEPVPEDSIIEDFYMTLRIAMKGYKIAYEPGAFAMELPSASVKEELKRKIRIAAGGIQSVVRLRALFNPFRYGILSFQFFSHRALRWTIAPLSLLLLLFFNVFLVLANHKIFYQYFLCLQGVFYFATLAGWFFENRRVKVKPLFVPYYFMVMNYAVYAGFFRYFGGKQTVLWEKAKRSVPIGK